MIYQSSIALFNPSKITSDKPFNDLGKMDELATEIIHHWVFFIGD
jgi:hypothetical protein